MYVAIGSTERFYGQASAAVGRGHELLNTGEYMAAIESYKEALRHHGKPSVVLENHIGQAYMGLEMYDRAVEHYSNALDIKDGAVDRTNRGWAYFYNNQGDLATSDAQTALMLEPVAATGTHTDFIANWLLASCYEHDNKLAALQHLDAAIAIAEKYGIKGEYVPELMLWREKLWQALN